MKKNIIFGLTLLLCLTGCAKQNYEESSSFSSCNTIAQSMTSRQNSGAASISIYHINDRCENNRGESLTITNCYLESESLYLESYLSVESLENIYLFNGRPSCLMGIVHGRANENVDYNEQKTFYVNNIDDLTSDSFEGVFTFVFSIKNIDAIEYPLYFRFFIIEKGCVDSIFVIE